MHVVENAAYAACQLKSLAYRKLWRASENLGEGFSLQILNYGIWPGSLRNGNDLHDSGMIQMPQNGGFPRESGTACAMDCEISVRHFDGNHLTRLAVDALENRRHPASFDEP